MKTKTILFILLLFSAMVSAQVKRVAVLETVDKENKVSYASKLILRTSLSKAIANLPDCEVYDRTDVDAIMCEHTFQRTGLVNSDQIKRLGEMTGADYILVAEAVKINTKNLFVTAKLLDVETARTIVTEMVEINVEHMQQGCAALAKKMFPDNKELDFGIKRTVGPQLIRNSKTDQKLYGIEAYSYGETQMDKKALESFLRNNSPDVYKRYLRGNSCIKAGWAIFGIGLATTAAGGACMMLSYKYEDKLEEFAHELGGISYNFTPADEREQYLYDGYRFYWAKSFLLYDLGIGLMSGGAGLTVISIPIMSAGYGVKNNIHKQYNKQANGQANLTLNLQSSRNGVGIALNF